MSQAAADQLAAEGHALFEEQRYAEAAARFERAATIFPSHHPAWKGLGHALLCLGRTHEAARAFDRAIGLRPDSATALWGGALMALSAVGFYVAFGFNVFTMFPISFAGLGAVLALAAGQPDEPKAHF